MKKKIWLPCFFVLVAQGATAQSVPSAGGQMQQIPVVPEMPAITPPVKVAPQVTQSAAPQAGAVFVVKQLNVTGATAYSASELQRVAGFESGREISLPALYEMAEKITQHYRQDGYPFQRTDAGRKLKNFGTGRTMIKQTQCTDLIQDRKSSNFWAHVHAMDEAE